jgi:hypothetical protein
LGCNLRSYVYQMVMHICLDKIISRHFYRQTLKRYVIWVRPYDVVTAHLPYARGRRLSRRAIFKAPSGHFICGR